MDVGIFYEIQVASPLKHREREYQVFHQVMDQIVAAEQAGFDSFWTVEHHFQPGFSHSSAPEVLYGAVSQRTSAERVATLDILSHGRVEMGTGRSITVQELGGFGIPHTETRERWEEAERAFLSYTATQVAATAHVLQSRRTGKPIEDIVVDPSQLDEYEGVNPQKVDLDFLVDNGMCVVGDPDTCINQMERIRSAAGLDLFLCMMQFWSIPHEKTMRAIELFGRHVVPHFRSSR